MLNNKASKESIKASFRANEQVCGKVMDIFSLVANKTRFRILCVLKQGDFCVNDIVDIIQMGKVSNISQQLRLLSMAGIIEKRRDKKQIFYFLKDQRMRKMIGFLESHYLNVKPESIK